MSKSRIRKLHESFLHAFRGLRLCITGERNFRVHMTAAFYVTAAALMGRVSATEAAVLCLCFGLTMGAELMNTAVERLCDKTARGYDSMVKDAKDIAAAAVFVCAAACVAVGFFVFLVHGALLTALRFLAARLWLLMLMIVTVPAAVWFVFLFWKKTVRKTIPGGENVSPPPGGGGKRGQDTKVSYPLLRLPNFPLAAQRCFAAKTRGTQLRPPYYPEHSAADWGWLRASFRAYKCAAEGAGRMDRGRFARFVSPPCGIHYHIIETGL